MGKNNVHCLLAFCLAMFGAYSPDAQGQVDPKARSEIFEEKLVKYGLSKSGISEDYEIVVADKPDIVENTAAEALRKFLGKGGLKIRIVTESKSSGQKRFLLGRESNLNDIRRLGDGGALKIRDVSAEDDGFHLKRIGQDVVIAGANPRGVLYGVYAFEDFITEGADAALDIKKVPYFRKRGSGPCYTMAFFDRNLLKDFPEEAAASLSRMGVNQLTDQGIGGNLIDFVRSDVFPFQKPPEPEFQRIVRAMSALCKKYGIEQYVFLNEPALPARAADLGKYPPEAIGTVKRPWGGDKNGIDRTLCVSSPIVQQYLRDMMKRFVREYPDIKGVQLYNMDVSAWLCTPALCDRCKIVCADSPPNESTPWETQARLVTLLAEAAHEERPGFDLRLWGAVHYHGRQFDRMIHAAQGYDSVLSSWTASDRTVMVPDAAEPDPAFFISREICAERAIPFHMICELNNLEQIPRSLPFPFHVCDALKKFVCWKVKNVTEIFGQVPEHNTINALVTREFQWNPDQDPEKFLTGLARRQFGEKAGQLMYRAWEEMEQAFDVWNDIKSGPFPLAGSETHLSIGTMSSMTGGLPPAILPDMVNYYDSMVEILTRVEPWLAAGYQRFKEQDFLDRMNRMNVHLAKAAEQAKQAVAAASDRDFIGIYHYDGADGRPTCKAYAELNHAPIAFADAYCRQRANMLQAFFLLKKLEKARAAHDAETVKATERLYHELIREDIGVQERFHELIADFAQMQPVFIRTGLTEKEVAALLSGTKEKIGKLKEFLAKQGEDAPSETPEKPGTQKTDL